jgi:hypothetical protein
VRSFDHDPQHRPRAGERSSPDPGDSRRES